MSESDLLTSWFKIAKSRFFVLQLRLAISLILYTRADGLVRLGEQQPETDQLFSMYLCGWKICEMITSANDDNNDAFLLIYLHLPISIVCPQYFLLISPDHIIHDGRFHWSNGNLLHLFVHGLRISLQIKHAGRAEVANKTRQVLWQKSQSDDKFRTVCRICRRTKNRDDCTNR